MKAGQLIGALSLTSLLLLGCERQSDTLSNSYNPTIDGVATDVTAQPPDLSILQPQVASVPSGTIRPPVPTPPVASAPAATEPASGEAATAPTTPQPTDVQTSPPPE